MSHLDESAAPSIRDDPLYDKPDENILVNGQFCLLVAIPLFILFCFVRRHVFRVYDANITHSNRKTIAGIQNGTFSWIRTTFKLPDNYLILLTGFDAFVFLKSLKLMAMVLTILTIVIGALLYPVYFLGPLGPKEHLYVRLSIRNVGKPETLWFPWVALVLTTVFVFYMVFTFYRSYVVARQAYLRSPSTFQALSRVEGYTAKLRSYEKCQKLFNIPSRTVVVMGIESTYSKERLASLFEDMGLGDIQSIHMVKDRSLITERLERLNHIHQCLEGYYMTFFGRLLERLESVDGQLKETLEAAKSAKVSSREKMALMGLVNGPSFYADLRPLYKRRKDKETVDAISYMHDKMVHAEEELDDLIREYTGQVDGAEHLSPLPYNAAASPGSLWASKADKATGSAELISLLSFHRLQRTLEDFKLTLWGTSASAIVVFDSPKSASVACQTLLSARPFSLRTVPAPMVTEVAWDNLYMPAADRTVRSVLGDVLYVLVNVLFMVFVTMLTSVTRLSFLLETFPSLKPVLERSPAFRTALQGILAPLGFNIALLLAPYLLMLLTYYQAHVDKAEAQLALMNRYSWFLFMQTFVVNISMPAIQLINAVVNKNFSGVLKFLETQVALTSALFFNVIMQKALIGLMVVITKPGDIIVAAFNRLLGRKCTPRKRKQMDKPLGLPLGFLYPEYAVLVFQITLSFAITTPLILPIGALFFALAYFAFRAQFIFSNKVPHESGGRHWPQLCTHMLFGQILAQFLTLLQFLSFKGHVQALLTLPLMVLTGLGMVSVNRRFRRRVTYQALCNESMGPALMLIKDISELREPFLRVSEASPEGLPDAIESDSACKFDWVPVTHPSDCLESGEPSLNPAGGDGEASPPLSIGRDSAQDLEEMENPYTNPVIFQRLKTLMLPLNFFVLIRFAIGRAATQPQGNATSGHNFQGPSPSTGTLMEAPGSPTASPATDLFFPPCLRPREGSASPSSLRSREQIAQARGHAKLAATTLSRYRLRWPSEEPPCRFLLIHKEHGEEALVPYVISLLAWLLKASPPAKLGLQVTVLVAAPLYTAFLVPRMKEPGCQCIQPYQLADGQLPPADANAIDMIITMGGDGTVLNAAWLFQATAPPIMSLHFGTVGFLSMFNFDEAQAVLTRVMTEGSRVNIRMRLQCTHVAADGATAVTRNVMNEVVVDRGQSPFMSYLDLYGDDDLLTSILADGLIIATTTGSTAYSMSAGGSVVHPDVPAILVTPICPHTLSFRPFLVPESMELTLRVSPLARTSAWISLDSRQRLELRAGEELRISSSPYPVTTVCQSNQTRDWFKGLSEALRWNEKPRKIDDRTPAPISDFIF